jgi:4-diphosphocytidyl-2-C-methyl-D-erythritol kinase
MSITKSKVVIRSGSKINLFLNVDKKLRPDGYHEIKSVMQSVSLSDELEFLVAPVRTEHQTGESAARVPQNSGIEITCNDGDIPLNENNLVHKASTILLKKFDLETKFDIKIKIKKSIPIGSGLAGGSSNAAATLLAFNHIFNLCLSPEELISIGNEVGSDVPFCLSGGTALVEGKGEVITRLPCLPFYWVVIAINGRKFSSGDIYDRFDLIGEGSVSKHNILVDYLTEKKYDDFFSNIYNDLEKVVVAEDKMVTTLENKALESGAFAAKMTGSGPAIFAFCSDLLIAKKVSSGLQRISSKVFLAHTTGSCQEFLS